MSSLLRRAESDIAIAKLLLSPIGNPTNDELFTDQAAYHVQQAIEKAMKYQLEMMGIAYKKTHHLVGLIVELEKNGYFVEPDLKRSAHIISDWEASSRYNDDFFAVKSDIEDAIQLYENLKQDILQRLEVAIN